MLSLIKRLLLYFYILVTKLKQRTDLLKELKQLRRPYHNIILEKPGLPDSLDEICGVTEGWADVQYFTAFHRDGTCMHYCHSNSANDKKEIYIHLPSVGTLFYSETDNDDSVEEHSITKKKRLIFEVVDPMKKWRLVFRGYMRMVSSVSESQMVFVRFHCYWNNISDPYDLWLDAPVWLLAGECSKLGLFNAMVLLSSKSIWFQQWGELHGRLTIEENVIPIRLTSCRDRKYITNNAYENHIQTVRSQHAEIDSTGHRYAYKEVKFKNGFLFTFGHVCFPSMESYYISDNKYEKSLEYENIKVGGKTLKVSETLSRRIMESRTKEIHCKKYTIDERTAIGVELLEKWNDFRSAGQKRKAATVEEAVSANENVILLDMSDARCRNKNLVGGKAANLSSLMSFGCNVPPAFCITTKALQEAIESHFDFRKSIENIERIIREMKLENLKSACDNAVKCCRKITIKPETIKAIESKLQDITTFQDTGVAVRSSAKGEDGKFLSTAGQLKTVLGIRGLDEVAEAIKTCWSCYFSFQSVEYRRQNGQVIIDGMGLVVQKMIHSDLSGVMMTNDPLTGREDKIFINASYQQGEAVVSGRTEPDTVVVGVADNGDFQILKEIVGSKTKRVELSPTGGTYTSETSVLEGICLSEDMIHRLCQVGKSIERRFKLEQDIEWAICGNSLYILQSRPITSIEEETDEELFHEFDTPVLVESDLITTCNIQEMMPGAASPLTTSYFVPGMSEGVFFHQYVIGRSQRVYHPRGFVAACGNSYFFNMSGLYVMAAKSSAGLKAKAYLELDLLGEECKEVTDDQIVSFKGTSFPTKWQYIIAYLYKIVFVNPKLELDSRNWEKQMYTYKIGNESDDAEELYKKIDIDRIYLSYIWTLYSHLMENPYTMIVKSILMGKSLSFSRENKEDLSNLLLRCGTVSAEVPKAITKLAKAIKDSGVSDEFLHLPYEECISLLNENKNLKCLFRDFMKKHGHRCIREAELLEKSWGQDSSKLIQSLKSILRNGFVEREDEPDDFSAMEEVINNLKTNLTPFKRWLVRRYMKKALSKVLERERGKSLIIKIIEAFKKAYWSLAKQMVREGRIPEEKLLFFLTHREVRELIDTRTPKLIQKAKRRMKIYPKQQAARYERISFGIPKTRVDATELHSLVLPPSLKVEGMPNGKGESTGRACIVMGEEDVDLIEKGDIMICQYTDVGWSPYFPLINGLVTELGGVLSHGAVIARECGIPCVVNVTNATKLLKTGDIVRINGSKGTVEKLFEN